MALKDFEKWLYQFVASTAIILVVMEVFEYAVLPFIEGIGGLFYFTSMIGGVKVPTAIVSAILLGIVFATAQYVLSPGASRYEATSGAGASRAKKSPSKHSRKGKARRKKRRKK